MKKDILLFSLLLAMVSSCQRKKEPEDIMGTPVFYLKGEIAGQAKTIEAGIDNYYLETGYSSDNDGILEFNGNFKKSCAGCKESFRVIIRDFEKHQNGTAILPDSSFANRLYDYQLAGSANIPYYVVSLKAEPVGNGGSVSHLWQFSDGSTSGNEAIIKTFKSGTVQEINYTCDYAGNCSSSISYKLKLKPFLNPSLLPDFNFVSLDNQNMLFKFQAQGDSASNYSWSFGDGGIAKGKTVYYGFSSGNNFTITLKQINGSDTNEISKNISASAGSGCNANFSKEITTIIDPLNKSTVTVEYTDEYGIVYSSKNLAQDLDNNFSIINSQEYIKNKTGQDTRLLNLLINCKLSNGTNTIIAKDLKCKMAVAIP